MCAGTGLGLAARHAPLNHAPAVESDGFLSSLENSGLPLALLVEKTCFDASHKGAPH
jgi:hypothetical protein